MFFIGYCAGCIGSPQLWTQRPRYREGVITSIVTWCLLFVSVIVYRTLCVWDNAKRDSNPDFGLTDTSQDVELDEHGQPKTDITDKQDRHFRYSL